MRATAEGFVDVARSRLWAHDYDVMVDCAWIEVPDGPIIGIACELNTPNMFECVLYRRASDEYVARNGSGFCGAEVDGVGWTADVPSATPHEDALDRFLGQIGRGEWECFG